MSQPPDRNWTAAGVTAAVLACVVVLFFYGYNFVDKPPYVSLSPQDNAHFTILFFFLEKVLYLAGAGVILFAALSAGLAAVKALGLGDLPVADEAVYAAALGLGGISLVTLFLGLLGLMTTATAAVVIVVFSALGITRLKPLFKAFAGGRQEPARWIEWPWLAAGLLAATVIMVYAFNPPMYFDTLEYHFGAPAEYLRAGRITYLKYNAYSNFPSNCEMLYYFSMALSGAKFAGAMLGKVLNADIALVGAGAAYCLGRWIHSRMAGAFAALALLTAPGFFQVATEGYVEPLQTLYTVLAVLAVGRFIQRGARGALLAGAIFTGLAMCVKYPAAVFTAVPLALAVLLRPGSAASRVRSTLIFSAAAILVVAPWLVKNLAMTGNPVYPVLYSVFGGSDWSALQEARFSFAHTPKGGLAGEQWARHILGLFFSNDMVSLQSFIFVPLLFVRWMSGRVHYVLGYAAVFVFLWFAATHRVDRFALPALAVLGAVSGAGLYNLRKGWLQDACALLAVVIAAMNVFFMSSLYGISVGLDPSVPLFARYEEFLKEKKPEYAAWTYLNEHVPRGAKVLLVAEAEVFYLDVDYSASTVFDKKPLEEMYGAAGGDPAAVAAKVREAGFSYVFANWATWKRQQDTYSFEFERRKEPGYSAVITPELFDAMEKTGRIKAVHSSGAFVSEGLRSFVLYSVE